MVENLNFYVPKTFKFHPIFFDITILFILHIIRSNVLHAGCVLCRRISHKFRGIILSLRRPSYGLFVLRFMLTAPLEHGSNSSSRYQSVMSTGGPCSFSSGMRGDNITRVSLIKPILSGMLGCFRCQSYFEFVCYSIVMWKSL